MKLASVDPIVVHISIIVGGTIMLLSGFVSLLLPSSSSTNQRSHVAAFGLDDIASH